jgi:ParB family chromosome partitioning protein
MLSERGYNLLAYEPHFQDKGVLNVREVVKQINGLHTDLSRNGLYDAVVLDSVLNSVVNSRFEHAVLTTCNALLKQDGRIYIGTRSLNFTERLKTFKTYNSHGRDIQFLDKENFGATYRSGVWTMQHFHTHDSLRNLLLEYFENVEIKGRESEVQLYAIASHPRKLPRTKVEEAINVEFNMEYPGNYHHNMHGELVAEIMQNIEKERSFL